LNLFLIWIYKKTNMYTTSTLKVIYYIEWIFWSQVVYRERQSISFFFLSTLMSSPTQSQTQVFLGANMHRQTNKQTNRQTDEQTDKQKNRKTDEQMNERTDKQTNRNRWTNEETSSQTDKRTNGQTNEQTNEKPDKQTNRWTNRKLRLTDK
jgi:hypothetical protein